MKELEEEAEVMYPDLAQEITTMAAEDQSMRRAAMEDPHLWDVELDHRNTKRLKEIVAEIGWPSISKVGQHASRGAWLLVQHADGEVKFQEECLAMMQDLPEAEMDRSNIAYLDDRIRAFSGASQLYGTQFHTDKESGQIFPYPIEDMEHLDERRSEMGLGSFAEYEQHMKEKYQQ